MKIADMNWMQVESYLRGDDRCIVPIGSTEQHAQLSLVRRRRSLPSASRSRRRAPLGVPVFPVMPFGLTPYFLAFPGTISLRVETLLAVVRDVGRLHAPGRVPAGPDRERTWRQRARGRARPGADGRACRDVGQVPQLVERAANMGQGAGDRPLRLARQLDGELSLDAACERGAAECTEDAARRELMRASSPEDARRILGDGSFGGDYQKPDEVMLALWATGVEETREALEGPWPTSR